MNYQFIGKTVVFEDAGEKVVALGDLHLGYEVGLRQSGIDIENTVWADLEKEFLNLFTRIGNVTYIVLLGDSKHQFAQIVGAAWRGFEKLLALLTKWCKHIIIIRGNHDTFLSSLTAQQHLQIHDAWIWRTWCFTHGDKDYPLLHVPSVKGWVLGHAHPALSLREGEKRELYKCFLVGTYARKHIILVPSFFAGVVGSDVLTYALPLPWKFRIEKYNVYVVGDEDVYLFGTVGSLT